MAAQKVTIQRARPRAVRSLAMFVASFVVGMGQGEGAAAWADSAGAVPAAPPVNTARASASPARATAASPAGNAEPSAAGTDASNDRDSPVPSAVVPGAPTAHPETPAAATAPAPPTRDLFGLGNGKPRPRSATPAASHALVRSACAQSAGSGAPRESRVGPTPTAGHAEPVGAARGAALLAQWSSEPADCVLPQDRFGLRATGALTWSLASAAQDRLPVADAAYDTLVTSAPGAFRDEVGVSINGASGLENRWRIDGAAVDDPLSGAAGLSLPYWFFREVTVTLGGAAARDAVSTGGAVDATLAGGTATHQVQAWVGGYQSRAPSLRAPYPLQYQLMRSRTATTPVGVAAVLAQGPLGKLFDGQLFYAAGASLALREQRMERVAARRVDADADGLADLIDVNGQPQFATEQLWRDTNAAMAFALPAFAKVRYVRHADDLSLAVVSQAARNYRFFTMATSQAAGQARDAWTGLAITQWQHRWPRTLLSVGAAWQRVARTQQAWRASAEQLPQVLAAYVPDQGVPAEIVEGCRDGTPAAPDGDAYPRLTNCPVPVGWYATGGGGRMINSTADRPSLRAELTHAVGAHTLRMGGLVEDARNIRSYRFTGGRYQRTLFEDHHDNEYYLEPGTTCDADPATPCNAVASVAQTLRNRYSAAFVQDTWRLPHRMRLEGGVRWERMQVGSKLDFAAQWAPRAAFAWDPLGQGRSRIFWALGRAFAMLPLAVNGGMTAEPKTARDVQTSLGPARVLDLSTDLLVFPGTAPVTQDEVVTGAELAAAATVTARLWGAARWQRQTIESTPLGLSNLERFGLPPRQSQLLVAEIALHPSRPVVVRFAYQWQRVRGATAGTYDPAQGEVQYLGRDVNTDTDNLYGALATDWGHRFTAELSRTITRPGYALLWGGRAVLASGRPTSTTAGGDGGVLLLPRGSNARTPMASTVQLRGAVRWRTLELGLEIHNVFDQRAPLTVDETYTTASVRPIVGGRATDLVFLRDQNGAVVTRSPTYRQPTSFAAPLAGFVGMRVTW